MDRLGTHRVDAEGEKVLNQKLTAVYFSTYRTGLDFTPELIKVYAQAQKEGVLFDVIFVSLDSKKEEMLKSMQEMRMPWLAVPHGTQESRRAKNFKEGILHEESRPCLVVLNAHEEVVVKNGCADIEELGFVALEKWQSMPVVSLESAGSAPQEVREPLGPPPAPEKKELPISELADRLSEFDGKVVEVILNHVQGFREVGEGTYRVSCSYRVGSPPYENQSVLIREAGREFFEAWATPGARRVQKFVYMRVHSETPLKIEGLSQSFRLEAVGLRYRKSKGTYSW